MSTTQIIAIMIIFIVIVGMNIAYMWYAVTRSRGQLIPLEIWPSSGIPLRINLGSRLVPGWVNWAYSAVLLVELFLLITLFNAIGLEWVGAVLFVLASFLPYELLRQRHNRKVKAGL